MFYTCSSRTATCQSVSQKPWLPLEGKADFTFVSSVLHWSQVPCWSTGQSDAPCNWKKGVNPPEDCCSMPALGAISFIGSLFLSLSLKIPNIGLTTNELYATIWPVYDLSSEPHNSFQSRAKFSALSGIVCHAAYREEWGAIVARPTAPDWPSDGQINFWHVEDFSGSLSIPKDQRLFLLLHLRERGKQSVWMCHGDGKYVSIHTVHDWHEQVECWQERFWMILTLR